MADFEQKVIEGEDVEIGQFTDATTGTITALSTSAKSDIILTGASTVAGIAGGYAGKELYLLNATGGPIFFNDEDSSATAANRLKTGLAATLTLSNNAGIHWLYDGAASRWRNVGYAVNSGAATTTTTDAENLGNTTVASGTTNTYFNLIVASSDTWTINGTLVTGNLQVSGTLVVAGTVVSVF
jgi:hypothetical protein